MWSSLPYAEARRGVVQRGIRRGIRWGVHGGLHRWLEPSGRGEEAGRDYLVWNRSRTWRGRVARDRKVSPSVVHAGVLTVRNFFDDITLWGWAERPERRLLFANDVPKLPRPLPRGLAPDTDAALMAEVARLEDRFARGLAVQEPLHRRSTACRADKGDALPDPGRGGRPGRGNESLVPHLHLHRRVHRSEVGGAHRPPPQEGRSPPPNDHRHRTAHGCGRQARVGRAQDAGRASDDIDLHLPGRPARPAARRAVVAWARWSCLPQRRWQPSLGAELYEQHPHPSPSPRRTDRRPLPRPETHGGGPCHR